MLLRSDILIKMYRDAKTALGGGPAVVILKIQEQLSLPRCMDISETGKICNASPLFPNLNL